MRDTSLLFTPLVEEVEFGETPFSTGSTEYAELQSRLQTIQGFVDSTEAALRMIVRHAASKSKSREALKSILHLALDQVSLATLATLMLDDINSCLNFIEQESIDSFDEELDALLCDLSGDAQEEGQDLLSSNKRDGEDQIKPNACVAGNSDQI